MGQQQSKDELLYQQVNYGNVGGIKTLREEGAGLEWVDKERKTPLIVACMNPEHYDVAKALVEMGANPLLCADNVSGLHQVVLDNGILSVTLSTPTGMITGIEYNGIDNLLEHEYEENNRGYWDLYWSKPDHPHDIIYKKK